MKETRTAIVERRKSSLKTLELTHNDDKQYIINLASHSSPALYRQISDIPVGLSGPLEWIGAMHDGLGCWGVTVEKKNKKATKLAKKNAPCCVNFNNQPKIDLKSMRCMYLLFYSSMPMPKMVVPDVCP
jgi:hypothetical protein